MLGGGISGDGLVTPLDSLGVDKGGIIGYRDRANPEMLVKVLNFCSLGVNSYAVFYAAATTVGFDLTVEDTIASVSKVYTNPDQTPAETVTDTRAFATCP